VNAIEAAKRGKPPAKDVVKVAILANVKHTEMTFL
jgi:hypothetical protein